MEHKTIQNYSISSQQFSDICDGKCMTHDESIQYE